MGAVAFIQLQKAFSPEQVEALANFMDTQAASKADLETATHRIELKFADVSAEIASVRSDLSETKMELKADIKLLEQRLIQQEQRMTIKLGGMLVVLTGIIIAAFRYLLMTH